MKAIVSEKGQVTIPKALRDRLGIRPGHALEFRDEKGRLVATKVTRHGPVASVYGVLKTRRRTNELIRSLRGAPDTT